MPIDATQAHALEPNDRGLIDLDLYRNDNFSLFGFELSQVMDNVILVEYSDLGDDTGQTVMRNGIMIPIAHVQRAWRIGRIILAGPRCLQVKAGDHVCFPSDKGIPCSNLDIEGVGVVRDAVFLNEDRIFGVCKPVKLKQKNASKSKRTPERSAK